ncbi:MAG: hypothetical protein ACLS4Z_11140 [Christensenellaceae bacterium]
MYEGGHLRKRLRSVGIGQRCCHGGVRQRLLDAHERHGKAARNSSRGFLFGRRSHLYERGRARKHISDILESALVYKEDVSAWRRRRNANIKYKHSVFMRDGSVILARLCLGRRRNGGKKRANISKNAEASRGAPYGLHLKSARGNGGKLSTRGSRGCGSAAR